VDAYLYVFCLSSSSCHRLSPSPFNLPQTYAAVVGLLLASHRSVRVAFARHEPEAPHRAAIAACWAFLVLIFSPSSSAAASRPAHPKFPADHGHADHGYVDWPWALIKATSQSRRPRRIFGGERSGKKSYKILDTSVIIDGRIATSRNWIPRRPHRHPQFVLRELQLVPTPPTRSSAIADDAASTSSSVCKKRHRPDSDRRRRFPRVREVDLKLIELAKLYEGKILTNDFNLNKVAQLQGVPCSTSTNWPTRSSPSFCPARSCGLHPERRKRVQPGRRLSR